MQNPCVPHVAPTPPELLRYCAHFSGLCCDEQPRKTALDGIHHEKTLTVREALFGRESVPLSMHSCMDSMAIKQHPFWSRPCMTPHFCGASPHIDPFEEPKTRGWGHRGRTGAAVDLRATLAGSSD
jgi:hypothetical protein